MRAVAELIESLHALGAKLDALLKEAQVTRELLERPRPHVRVESVPHVDAAKVLGCSLRRVEQLLKSGVLRPGRKYGKRGMVTLESIELALQPMPALRSRSRRAARGPIRWQPINRALLR